MPAGVTTGRCFFAFATDRGILIGTVISRTDAPKSAMVSAKFVTIFKQP
jgi:hypothetical protein